MEAGAPITVTERSIDAPVERKSQARPAEGRTWSKPGERGCTASRLSNGDGRANFLVDQRKSLVSNLAGTGSGRRGRLAGSTAFGWSETAIGGSAAAVPRAWMAIDADDAPVPAPLGDAERLVEGAIHVRDRQLPPELCNVTMLVSPTSNSGLRGPTLFRSRLWLGPIRCASGM